MTPLIESLKTIEARCVRIQEKSGGCRDEHAVILIEMLAVEIRGLANVVRALIPNP